MMFRNCTPIMESEKYTYIYLKKTVQIIQSRWFRKKVSDVHLKNLQKPPKPLKRPSKPPQTLNNPQKTPKTSKTPQEPQN